MNEQLNRDQASYAAFYQLVSQLNKEAGKTVGHTTRAVARVIGHGTRDAAKVFGEGVKRL